MKHTGRVRVASSTLSKTARSGRGNQPAPWPYGHPAEVLPQPGGEQREVPQGLAILIISRDATDLVEQLVRHLDRAWFDVLYVKRLSREESSAVRDTVFGRESHISPAVAVAALDVNPKRVTWTQRRRWSQVDNAHLVELRAALKWFLGQRPTSLSLDHLSLSSNSAVAAEWARVAMPEELGRLTKEAVKRLDANVTPFPVVQDITGSGGHAKVELVRYDGGLAVCKTFRTGKERFLERELLARTELGRTISEMPGILASGTNWVLTPYYQDILSFDLDGLRLLPLHVARQMVEVLEKLYTAGYAYMDVKPENILVDRRDGFKLIDFEYLHRYEAAPASFAASYDVVGAPDEFEGDKPLSRARTYATMLHYYTGLDLSSLRHDPPWQQHLKRTLYRWGSFVPKQLPRKLKSSALRLVNLPFAYLEEK